MFNYYKLLPEIPFVLKLIIYESKWGSEEIRREVKGKKEPFSVWRKVRARRDMEEYRRMKRAVKKIV